MESNATITHVSFPSSPFTCQCRLQVIGDEIVYKYTVYHDLQKVFTHRADMHRQVYKHRCAEEIGGMWLL